MSALFSSVPAQHWHITPCPSHPSIPPLSLTVAPTIQTIFSRTYSTTHNRYIIHFSITCCYHDNLLRQYMQCCEQSYHHPTSAIDWETSGKRCAITWLIGCHCIKHTFNLKSVFILCSVCGFESALSRTTSSYHLSHLSTSSSHSHTRVSYLCAFWLLRVLCLVHRLCSHCTVFLSFALTDSSMLHSVVTAVEVLFHLFHLFHPPFRALQNGLSYHASSLIYIRTPFVFLRTPVLSLSLQIVYFSDKPNNKSKSNSHIVKSVVLVVGKKARTKTRGE